MRWALPALLPSRLGIGPALERAPRRARAKAAHQPAQPRRARRRAIVGTRGAKPGGQRAHAHWP
eukprot:362948-Chlamydomonas_euryale.AAC.5